MQKIALFQNNSKPYSQSVVATLCKPPFGMLINERSYTSGDYMFGFNGKEKDDEAMGNGNSYDYGFRIYHPRIAKFLSVDPILYTYPYLSTYQFASNIPIAGVDLDGLEYYFAADGTYLGKGSDPKNIEVRLGEIVGKTKSGANIIEGRDILGKATSQWVVIHKDINLFLDRVHWSYGEVGSTEINEDKSDPFEYIASAINNQVNANGGGAEAEEKSKRGTWKDAHNSYSAGTIQTGNDLYTAFNKVRSKILKGKSPEEINSLLNGKRAFKAAIGALTGAYKDPTGGATNWVSATGDGEDNETFNNKVETRIPTVKINSSSRWWKAATIFYKIGKNDKYKEKLKK